MSARIHRWTAETLPAQAVELLRECVGKHYRLWTHFETEADPDTWRLIKAMELEDLVWTGVDLVQDATRVALTERGKALLREIDQARIDRLRVYEAEAIF